jgi:hypothetical protein
VKGRGDDCFDDDDDEERRLGAEFRPDDGCRYGCDDEQEREQAKPGVGQLIWGFRPLGERVGVDSDFEVFAENGDVFAKIEAIAEFGDCFVALGYLCDG